MRTTVDIDEYVLRQAKDDARDAGITLGRYIERALQRERSTPRADDAVAPLPTFGGELLIPIHEMTNAEIQEFLDEDVPLDKRR